MSSIGLAISNFFTGGKGEEDENKSLEEEQGEDTPLYFGLGDANDNGNPADDDANARLTITPEPAANKYCFAESVAAEHAKKSQLNKKEDYDKIDSSGSEIDEIDDTNAIN